MPHAAVVLAARPTAYIRSSSSPRSSTRRRRSSAAVFRVPSTFRPVRNVSRASTNGEEVFSSTSSINGESNNFRGPEPDDVVKVNDDSLANDGSVEVVVPVLIDDDQPPEETEAARVREHLYKSVDLWSTSMRARIPGGGAESGARPRFRLAYMAMRNRAEVPRLIMEEAGCPYEFDVIGFQLWKRWVKANDESLPFGKVPVIYSYDPAHRSPGGEPLVLGNETAITRFLARELGMDGAGGGDGSGGGGAMMQAKLDMLYVQYFQTLRNNGVTHEGEHYAVGALREAVADADAAANAGEDAYGSTQTQLTTQTSPPYRAMPRVNDFSTAERSIAALGVFEEHLGKSSTSYFADSPAPTYVDIAIFCELFELAEPGNVPDFATRFELPLLGAHLETMSRRPRIAAYIRSLRRMPRYKRPGYTYCAGKFSPAWELEEGVAVVEEEEEGQEVKDEVGVAEEPDKVEPDKEEPDKEEEEEEEAGEEVKADEAEAETEEATAEMKEEEPLEREEEAQDNEAAEEEVVVEADEEAEVIEAKENEKDEEDDDDDEEVVVAREEVGVEMAHAEDTVKIEEVEEEKEEEEDEETIIKVTLHVQDGEVKVKFGEEGAETDGVKTEKKDEEAEATEPEAVKVKLVVEDGKVQVKIAVNEEEEDDDKENEETVAEAKEADGAVEVKLEVQDGKVHVNIEMNDEKRVTDQPRQPVHSQEDADDDRTSYLAQLARALRTC